MTEIFVVFSRYNKPNMEEMFSIRAVQQGCICLAQHWHEYKLDWKWLEKQIIIYTAVMREKREESAITQENLISK